VSILAHISSSCMPLKVSGHHVWDCKRGQHMQSHQARVFVHTAACPQCMASIYQQHLPWESVQAPRRSLLTAIDSLKHLLPQLPTFDNMHTSAGVLPVHLQSAGVLPVHLQNCSSFSLLRSSRGKVRGRHCLATPLHSGTHQHKHGSKTERQTLNKNLAQYPHARRHTLKLPLQVQGAGGGGVKYIRT